ncbi:MAG: S8 family serine peptidase [Chloroflexi bacterium]|nr:S8 family serine peptidase [Chloroflexota bacterium]
MRAAPVQRWLLSTLLLVLCLVALAGWASPAQAQGHLPADGSPAKGKSPAPDATGFAEGEVLVRFRGSVPPSQLNGLLKEKRLSTLRHIKPLGVQVLALPPGLSVEDAVKALRARPEVEYAEPNYLYHALDLTDPGLANQWPPDRIEAPAAWEITAGDPAVAIAIVDTGVDYLHSELAPNLWSRPSEIPGNGLDDDANGYVDDVHGWDFINSDANPLDDHFHGTHVAGIAAAAPTDNPQGLVGICPRCAIMPVKVLNASGSGTLDAVANGILYAADSGARVINLSLAGTSGSFILENAINYAWDRGAVIVAGAGNSGRDQLMYPAAYARAMAIASSNRDDLRSCFSNYGDGYVALAAPGELVYSTTPRDAAGNDTYATYSGTSMATPHAAGLAGLIISQDPARSNEQVRALMESTAEDLGPVGVDPFFGHGRINALRALTEDTSATEPPAGLFADTLSATGYPHARKLVRDDDGLLHWAWHSVTGGYRVLYATSADGVVWSPAQAVFQSSAETGSPALATDGAALYLAFASREGSANARIWFALKPAGSGWSAPVPVLGGAFNAVRPALYLDPTNGRLHLAAASDNDGSLYYAASDDGGLTWSAARSIDAASGPGQTARYAALHAAGDHVTLAARTTEPAFYGLMAVFRLLALHSADGGQTWSGPVELSSDSDSAGDEPGLSLAGVGHRLYLAYAAGDHILFRRSDDGLAYGDPVDVGAGLWPSIAQGEDGQGWVAWEDAGSLWWRRYTGDGWDSPEQILTASSLSKTYYPNLKLGTSGGRVEWVATHCNGAPFRLSYEGRALDEMPVNPSLAFSAPSYAQDEGAGPAIVQVVMSEPAARAVTVAYATTDGSALAGQDYTSASGTLTFAPGETVAELAVPLLDDNRDEPDQELWVTLSDPVNGRLGAPAAASLTIVDNDGPPEVNFKLSSAYVNESAGVAEVVVRLSPASELPVTVAYATQAGTATSGTDYAEASGTVDLAPGVTSAAVRVAIWDDVLAEADETILLALSDPDHAILGSRSSSTLMIDDNDTLDFSTSLRTVNESAGQAVVTVLLSAASSQEVRVSYACAEGTATAGLDYAPMDGTLVLAPGETSYSLALPIIADLQAEADETFTLTLFDPVNAGLGSPDLVTIKIYDNDTLKFSLSSVSVPEGEGQEIINVRLNAASDQEVRVDYAALPGTAAAGEDYVPASGTLVFAPGQTAQSFAVTILDDLLAEEAETVQLVLANPVNAELGAPALAALTIGDNDAFSFGASAYSVKESDGQAVLTVKLNGPSSVETRVAYATADGSALAGQDYLPASGTLIFAPGETSRTFTVNILSDQEAEEKETVLLALSGPVNAGLGAPATATLAIEANDAVRFSLSYYSAYENASEVVVAVKLNAPADREVRVDYATGGGTATPGQDYLSASGTVILSPGETSRSLSVRLLDDSLAEATETFGLTLSNPVNAGLGSPSTASVSIKDNDSLKFGSTSYLANESAGQVLVTVKLNVAVEEEVRVDYACAGGTATASEDYVPAQGTLIFAPGQTSQTFAVTILDDTRAEAGETILLALANPVNAGLGASATTTISITDNDALRFSLSNNYVAENAGQAVISVRLSAASGVEVRVDYRTGEGTATAGADYLPASGTLIFAPGQTSATFAVTIIDDAMKESNETIPLALSSLVNAELGTPSLSTLTIRYND